MDRIIKVVVTTNSDDEIEDIRLKGEDSAEFSAQEFSYIAVMFIKVASDLAGITPKAFADAIIPFINADSCI